MAIQSSFYSGTALESRTFPSTKHIATKAHMAIWRQQVSDDTWVQTDIDEYQLINNSCVLNEVTLTSLYYKIEVRVADAPDELTNNPTDIAVVSGVSSEIVIVSGISTEVATLAGVSTAIASLYTDKVTLDSLYADKVTLDSIYTDKSKLDSLYTDKAKLDSLYADKATLDSLFADKVKLDALYTSKAAMDSLYVDKAKLDSLYADKITLDSLYADKATLDSLFADKVKLDGLFASKTAIDSLYLDKAKLDSLFADKVTLDRLYTSVANIDSVGASIVNVDTVATDIASVNLVSPEIASVVTVAANLTDVNNFNDTYYGALAVAPTIGTHPTLGQGDLYYDSGLDELRVYDGTTWKSAGSTVNGTSKRQTFVATAGQTNFVITGGYDAGFADVYVEGIKLINGVDVDVSSGAEVVLSTGAGLGDDVDVVAYGAFVLADYYTKAEQDLIHASLGGGSALTALDVKNLYESNTDTNVYTDAEKAQVAVTETSTQLDNRDTANRSTDNHTDGTTNGVYTLAERARLLAIEDSATADQTASEIETLYEGIADTNKYTDVNAATVSKVNNTAVTSITFNADGTMTVVIP